MNETLHNPNQIPRDNRRSPAPVESRPKKLLAASRTTGRWFMFALAVLLILIAILLLLVRIGLPWLGTYKGELETRLSEQLNSPVVIDDLSVRWERLGPKLSAQGVSLGESAQEQIVVDEVLIDMNVLNSIGQRTAAIDELTLVGVNISMEATESGRLQLQGLEPKSPSKRGDKAQASSNAPDVLSLLMNTKRVGLQDSTITITSEMDEEPLTISELNMLATNDNDLHQLRVDMKLPEELGGLIELGVDMVGTSDDIRNASADIHLKATGLKVDGIRSLQAQRLKGLRVSTTGIAKLDATTQLEIWGSVSDGSLQTARGQLQATDLVDLNKQERILDKISTDIVFANTPRGWKVSTDALELTNGDEITSVEDVVYEVKPRDGTAWKLDARGDTLKLDVATRLVLSLFDDAGSLPRAKWLAQASPKGDLNDWNASVGLVNGKPDFTLYSVFNKLELTSAEGVPGVKNIDGTIDMANNMGKITMQGEDMGMDLPAMYSGPIALEKLYGEFDIDVQDPMRTSLKGDVAIEDAGFDSSTRFEVKLKPGSSPHVYTQGKFSIEDIATAKRLMPTRLFRASTTAWFERALLAGQASNGELLMFGDIDDFPFEDNEGVFKLSMDFQDTTVDYLEGWPELVKTKGRLDMEGASMRVLASDGYMDGMRLSNLDMRIANLDNPVMELSSTSAGKLSDMILFANTGPLKETLRPAFADVTGTGRAQMDIDMSVPLRSTQTGNTVASAQAQVANPNSVAGLKVNGSVFLRNNSISFNDVLVDLENVDGAVGFTTDSVRINNLEADVFGKPMRINAKTEGKGDRRTMEVTMAGRMAAKTVLENYDIPLTQFVEGDSPWNVSLRIPTTSAGTKRDGIVVAAVSGLVGTRLKFPAPLGKSSASSTRLALSTRINPDSPNQAWLIDYGDTMRSLVRINDAGMQAFSGRFGGGSANEDVYDGIRLQGNMDRLSLDGWVEGISDFIDGLPASDTQTPIMPISADLNVNRFIVGTEGVGSGKLQFNTDSDYINMKLDSPWLNGSTRYPRVHWKKDLPIAVRVTSVDMRIIDALDSAPASEPGDELDPRELPPIHARIEQVRWDQLDLKGLTIRTSPAASGLNIDTFGFAYRSAQLIGNGYWRLRDPQGVNPLFADQHISRLNLTLQSDNYGRLLSDVGFDGILAEGEGVIEGSLQWSGPGYKPALEDLVGEMDLAIEKGRILSVEPGAARFAGLFAFQTIPRRLSLDFKDLVLDGLDYETVQGTVQLANGIAHTPLTQLNGPVGVVDITGESNLVTQQYNQRLTVLPRVSAALPIIGIISGGATAGLGALFAGGVLKAIGLDFDRIGLRDYTLTGSWDDPSFTHVPFVLPGQ